MKRFKRLVLMMAVNFLLFVVGLTAIELFFGGWISSRRLNRLNLVKGRVFRYDVSHLYSVSDPIVQYSRDRYGLRGAYGKPGDIDILTVGGSTTDQRYIRDGETWQDVLHQICADRGIRIVVANGGVDGQSTYGHIKNFEWWFSRIPGLKPKYVLFYVGINDFYKEAGHAFDHLVDNKFSLKRVISENSALWHKARTLRGAYKAMVVNRMGHRSIDFSGVRWTGIALQGDYDFMSERLHEYADRLRVLSDMTREFGAEPIFVSQPSRRYRFVAEGLEGNSNIELYDGHEYNGVDYYYMMRKLDAVTESVAREKKALFVDLASHQCWSETDFYDLSHMTPQGAKKVGMLLYRSLENVIRECGLSPSDK